MEVSKNFTPLRESAKISPRSIFLGRMNDFRREEARTVTREAMEKLHKALETMPTESDEVDAPVGKLLSFDY